MDPPADAGGGRTDWARVDATNDEEIAEQIAGDPDTPPELDDAWFATAARLGDSRKVPISLRVDPDVLEWFRSQGEGHLTRMNTVLRAYALHHGMTFGR